jgi:hypothetical protein
LDEVLLPKEKDGKMRKERMDFGFEIVAYPTRSGVVLGRERPCYTINGILIPDRL